MLPDLIWGPSAATAKLDDSFHSAEERRQFMRPSAGMSPELRAKRRSWMAERERVEGKALCCPERLSKLERLATPRPFAELLLDIAARCRRG
jgi:hypothetical protein